MAAGAEEGRPAAELRLRLRPLFLRRHGGHRPCPDSGGQSTSAALQRHQGTALHQHLPPPLLGSGRPAGAGLRVQLRGRYFQARPPRPRDSLRQHPPLCHLRPQEIRHHQPALTLVPDLQKSNFIEKKFY